MNPVGPGKGWAIYGSPIGHVRDNARIVLWRKGQKCRWMTPAGEQVGPEQKNVAPALVWADVNGFRCAW